MLNTLIAFSVRRSGVAIVLALLWATYAVYCLSQAGLDVFPEFSPKSVVIQTEAPGHSPEQVEVLVTQVVERSLAGMPNLKRLKSESIQGLGIVTAVFDDATDIYRDRQLVAERLQGIRDRLPAGVSAPLPLPLSSSSATVLTLGMTSSRADDLMHLRTVADWRMAPRILSVPGVADLNVFGGAVRQLQLQVRPEALRRHGLDIRDVANAARSLVALRGAGIIENTNQRFTIQLSQQTGVEDIREAILIRQAGANIRVRDVADVTLGEEPRISAASIMGEPGVVLMVIGQLGANTLTVSRAVEAVLQDMKPLLQQEGISLHTRLFRPTDYIENSAHNMLGHLIIGGMLVFLVLYAFLQNIGPALISALAIPLSLLTAALALMQWGVSLNVMVVGGLGIALGEVVDDAIIDVENIFRRAREPRDGDGQTQTSLADMITQAALEVRGSVVYASFIVAIVFIPLLTLQGVAGRLFAPMGGAYILAVLASLIVALVVTPALCHWRIHNAARIPQRAILLDWLRPRYEVLLRMVFAHWRAVLFSGLVGLSLAVFMLTRMGGGFLPALREGHYIVHTLSLPGTSLDESIRIGNSLTKQFLKVPGVRSVSQWAGRAERGADTYGSHYSEFEVALDSVSGREQQRILEALRAILTEMPGIVAEINTFLIERVDETISGYTAPVVVNVFAKDFVALDSEAERVAAVMGSMPGAVDVQMRSPAGAPVIDVRLRADEMILWGVQPGAVMDTLTAAFSGVAVGEVLDGNQRYDVAVILSSGQRREPGNVAALTIRTPDNTLVPLERLAEVRQRSGRYNVLHQDLERVHSVTCGYKGQDLSGFVSALRQRLLEKPAVTPGAYLEIAGAAVERNTTWQRLVLHAALSSVLVLLLVYLAVGGMWPALIIIINFPFALIGGILSAALTGGNLSVGSFVGFVTLFGITVRNSIMLVSHYRHLVETERSPWNQATAMQGAQDRLPSILMTALVTALAMLPVAIDSDNAGREIMGPMAAIIVGGLITSTLLNLLLLPPLMLRYARFRPTSTVDSDVDRHAG